MVRYITLQHNIGGNMKVVKIVLSAEAKKHLEDLQHNGSGLMRERSLAILHCSVGKKILWIAHALNRRPLTVRNWIDAYLKNGIEGLKRAYSPGRPSFRRSHLKPRLEKYLELSPRDYGWGEDIWTTQIINAQFEKEIGRKFGTSTISRLLKDAGYTFKRAKKTTSVAAPSKVEKLERVQEIAKQILEFKADDEVEVVFLDESHFSTDPYVVRGWHKKGVPFFPPDTQKAGKPLGLWCIRAGNREFLLEERTTK